MLTDKKLQSLKTPGRYAVGGVPGIYVQVSIGVGGVVRRSFVLRYKHAGRAREMGLGAYPAVSLAEARDKAADARKLLRDGTDPLANKAEKRGAEALERAEAHVSFQQASDMLLRHLIQQKADSKFPQRTARSWRNGFKNHCAKINPIDVRDLKHAHIAGVLATVANGRGKTKRSAAGGPTVASMLRSRIERVIDFAAAHGYRDPDQVNPARIELLRDIIGKAPAAVHFAAPPLDQAPALYRSIRDVDGIIYRAVEWMILGCSRLRETLDAKFDSVDLEARIWTVPASKTGRTLFVPLTTAMIRVYEAAAAQRTSDYLFPGRFGSPVASSTIRPALERIGIPATASNHGWRSVWRDWAGELGNVPRDIAEFQIGHVTGGVEGAYRRMSALEARRVYAERYADWLNGTEAQVIPFPKAAAV